MYKSPITVLESFMDDIMEQRDDKIVAIVQSKIDVDVDKDELIRALQYDRNQYNAGYKDGKADAMRWIPVSERLPEKDVLVLCIGPKGGMFLGYPRCVWEGESNAYTIAPNQRHSRYTKYWMPLPEPPEETE